MTPKEVAAVELVRDMADSGHQCLRAATEFRNECGRDGAPRSAWCWLCQAKAIMESTPESQVLPDPLCRCACATCADLNKIIKRQHKGRYRGHDIYNTECCGDQARKSAPGQG